jgi:BMFP domain-containing protein YqiC
MKKTLLTTALALSAMTLAFAEDATGTPALPPALPPMVSTGDQKIDEQVRALHKEMEGKIKAIRDEYQKKLKALIGERKVMMASTTKDMPKGVKEGMKEVRKDMKDARKGESEVRGTSTKAEPKGNAWGFFRRFFGLSKPVQATTTP